MITTSFYSTKFGLNRNLSEVQLQCSAIESIATSSSELKSTLILVSLMVVSSHQSEKLSQLQTMLEAGRAGPLPVADRFLNMMNFKTAMADNFGIQMHDAH